MAEALNPNEHQQEDRAAQASALAEKIEKREDRKITLEGETIEIGENDDAIVVIANGDDTFLIKDGPGHLDAEQALKHIG